MRIRAGWLGFGLVVVLFFAQSSSAYFLDSARRFDVRVRAYSQLGIMTESSERAGCPNEAQVTKLFNDPKYKGPANRVAFLTQMGKLYKDCPPEYDAGDLGQQRNFYNPEFDANLTDFMHWAWADEFKFRFAWWGFYDGLYDYLNGPWNDHREQYKARFSQSDHPSRESFTFNDENKNPRHIYASRNRINELYFDYTHGPFFLRVGRQAISWGESDTIALLDVSNPFDLTLGAPGFFQDVDEARIPLYTIRSTYKLIQSWGPLSSVFSDVYLVPGPIDTTVPIDPITAGISPFNPDQADPQLSVDAQGQGDTIHTAVVSRLPENTWANSRWGARLTGILFRDYTIQGWFFRTFNQAPTPLLTNASAFGLLTQKKGTVIDDRGFRVPVCNNHRTPAGRFCGYAAPAVTILERRLESVIGIAATWFSQPVNGILKAEAEYFIDEPAFIPGQNLNPRVQLPASIRKAIGDTTKYSNTVAKADYLRWVFGYDRNFFWQALNPTNSFILVMSYNSQVNVTEWSTGKDYRTPSAKPGHSQTRNGPVKGVAACQGAAALTNPLCVQVDPHDFVDSYPYDGFLQATVRTDYLHGQLEPQLTFIAGVHGYYAVQPTVTYRLTDNVLLGATYSMIAGAYKGGLGTFRSHDMVQLRVTGQFN